MVHESTDFGATSSDDELDDLKLKEFHLFAAQMAKSKDQTD